jgi:hypothetical protein
MSPHFPERSGHMPPTVSQGSWSYAPTILLGDLEALCLLATEFQPLWPFLLRVLP